MAAWKIAGAAISAPAAADLRGSRLPTLPGGMGELGRTTIGPVETRHISAFKNLYLPTDSAEDPKL
jgi:hypothetical protein